jgi:multidrug efflux pump subunit AcrB
VVPLMLAAGAGAEMQRTLGVAVFAGMLQVIADEIRSSGDHK